MKTPIDPVIIPYPEGHDDFNPEPGFVIRAIIFGSAVLVGAFIVVVLISVACYYVTQFYLPTKP